jgi:hypothetical protein
MSASEFTTRGDVEAFLQNAGLITTGLLQDSIDRALREADAAIRNYTNQYLSFVEDDTVTIDGGGRVIFLPQLPVTEVVSIEEDGEALTVTDDYIVGRYGVIHRVGRRWATGIQNIVVTYSHGYESIPQDITDIATRAASRAYQAGLKAADTAGVPGVQSKTLGDFSVTFAGDGNIADGLMGASGARLLLMSEKEMLNRYRLERQL